MRILNKIHVSSCLINPEGPWGASESFGAFLKIPHRSGEAPTGLTRLALRAGFVYDELKLGEQDVENTNLKASINVNLIMERKSNHTTRPRQFSDL